MTLMEIGNSQFNNLLLICFVFYVCVDSDLSPRVLQLRAETLWWCIQGPDIQKLMASCWNSIFVWLQMMIIFWLICTLCIWFINSSLRLLEMFENSKTNCPSKFSDPKLMSPKSLFNPTKQPKTKRYLIYNDIRHKKQQIDTLEKLKQTNPWQMTLTINPISCDFIFCQLYVIMLSYGSNHRCHEESNLKVTVSYFKPVLSLCKQILIYGEMKPVSISFGW